MDTFRIHFKFDVTAEPEDLERIEAYFEAKGLVVLAWAPSSDVLEVIFCGEYPSLIDAKKAAEDHPIEFYGSPASNVSVSKFEF